MNRMPQPLDHPSSSMRPLVDEIAPTPEPTDVFERLSRLPGCVFFDSAMHHPELGRFSYLAADPFDTVVLPADTSNPLQGLRTQLDRFASQPIDELPPFQGGAAGLFSYDLARSWETLPRPKHDEFKLPAVAVGLYDVVVAFDHRQHRCWIISQGWPKTHESDRQQHAQERLKQFRTILDLPTSQVRPSVSLAGAVELKLPQHSVRAPGQLSGATDGLLSNFSSSEYMSAVGRVIEYIHAGDVFQVNLAQRLLHAQTTDSVSLYLRLRAENPAPFAGYFDLGNFQIVSASPERFLRVNEGLVETRPIKGTRQRVRGAEAELFTGDELKQSEKDRAENVMIVDLMRNDLSRVCDPNSVVVDQLCEVETYQYVQHLVSSVTGRLSAGKTPIDLLSASFPGGSITGAPKVRAMQIIAELEPHARGAYCGSLGYLTNDGQMDMSILIRTITAGGGWWQMPVGGGIVAQSDPKREYAETWHKAEGLLRAVASCSP